MRVLEYVALLHDQGLEEPLCHKVVREAVALNELRVVDRGPDLLSSQAEGVVPPALIQELVRREGEHRLVATLPVSSSGCLSTLIVFRMLLACAYSMIRISSPFLDLEGVELLAAALRAVAGRGVPVRLLTRQGAERQAGVRGLREILGERLEVRDYYFRGTTRQQVALHAKCILSDGVCAYLGSAEIRQYALTINYEMGVLVFQHSILTAVRESFDAVWEQSPVIH